MNPLKYIISSKKYYVGQFHITGGCIHVVKFHGGAGGGHSLFTSHGVWCPPPLALCPLPCHTQPPSTCTLVQLPHAINNPFVSLLVMPMPMYSPLSSPFAIPLTCIYIISVLVPTPCLHPFHFHQLLCPLPPLLFVTSPSALISAF